MVGDGADIITPETDIRIFIQHNQSKNPQHKREVFQPYVASSLKSQPKKTTEPLIQDNYLQDQFNSHKKARMSENSKDEFEIIPMSEGNSQSDKEILNTQFRNLVFESKPISIEQKGYLIQLMHEPEMRDVIVEILSDVNNSFKPVKSYECLKLISDVIRFILTLFVHEQLTDFRLLYSIMDSSQTIYFLGAKKRKTYLSELLVDHGIWSDSSSWSDCIDFYLTSRIDDAIARKKRKEQNENEKKTFKSLFSGKLIKDILSSK